MTPGEIAGIIASLAALVGAASWIATLSLNQITRRKLAAEATKAESEISDKLGLSTKTVFSAAGDIIENLRKEVARLSARLTEMETRLDCSRKSEDQCQEQLDKANSRIAALVLSVERLEARAAARDMISNS